jgi:hypothetical protein
LALSLPVMHPPGPHDIFIPSNTHPNNNKWNIRPLMNKQSIFIP